VVSFMDMASQFHGEEQLRKYSFMVMYDSILSPAVPHSFITTIEIIKAVGQLRLNFFN